MRPYLFVWSLLFCLPLMAVDPADEQKEPPTIAETLTVTAELAPVKVKQATAKVSVIDDQQIQKRLVSDVRDLIKYEPGVYVPNDGSRLGLNGFNIRGIGENRVLTRVDGVASAQEFSFGPIATHQFSVDVDTLKSVEILRGASSSLYGSDALGGVVSLATKDPSDYLQRWGKSQGFRLKAGYDGKTDAQHLSFTGVTTLDDYQFLFHATRREHEERDNQASVATEDFSRTVPNDQDGNNTQLMAKVVRSFSSNNRLRLTVEHFDSNVNSLLYTSQGLSSNFGIQTLIADAQADDQQDRFRISLDQRLTQMDLPMMDELNWRVHIQSLETKQETVENRTTLLPSFNVNTQRTGSTHFEQDTLGAEITLGKSWFVGQHAYRLTYGLSAEETEFGQLRDRRDLDLDTGNPDAYTGTLIFPTRYFPKSTVSELGAYVQMEAYLFDDRVKITPGLRYDHYRLSPDKNDTIFMESTGATEPPVGMDDDAISPKLGLLVNFNEHVAWTAHYAKGFRTPSYSSVNSGFTNINGGYQSLPNPDLTPEESVNLETGIKLHGDRGSMSLNYFQNDFDDFIADTQFVGMSETGLLLFQALNLNNVAIDGFEFVGDFLIDEAWTARLSYADIDGEDRDTGNPIESIEPSKVVAGLLWHRDRTGGELSLTHVASRSADDVVEEDAFLPEAYEVIDLTFYYELNRHLRGYVGAFNLADETYYPFSDVRGRSAGSPTLERYTAPGRNFSFNLRYQW